MDIIYYCFNTIEKRGYIFPDTRTGKFSETPLPGMNFVDVDEYPDIFYNDGDWEHKLVEGWHNLEKYTWDGSGFVPFDIYNDVDCVTGIKEYYRRRRINKDINMGMGHQTEIKKLRKAIKLIADHLKIDLSEFMLYNDYVEGKIEEHPKTREYFDKIDIRKVNGVG